MFYNDLYYQYFGEGYIINFTVDHIKSSRYALSYQVFHKNNKMTLCQMMKIYNHLQALYHRFTYFYKTEFHNKDFSFNNCFFSKLTQFSVNYNTNINSDGNNEYRSFLFLDILKLYEHHNMQEKICRKKLTK